MATTATQVQFRRGNSAQVSAFTGAVGECIVNTDTHKLHVQDGVTAGGWAYSANQQVLYYMESAPVLNQFIGGRYRWNAVAGLNTADVVCGSAPIGGPLTLTLWINGVPTSTTITVLASQTAAGLNLSDLAIPVGYYVQWQVTAVPAPESAPTQISITMNVDV